MNKLLVFRLILALIFWTVLFFPALFIPRIWQYNTLWPIFSNIFLFAAKMKVFYEGKGDLKKVKNTIFVANHRSFADTFAITVLLRKPFTIVFISWMSKWPFFRILIRKMGLIAMDKYDLIQQKKSLDQIIKMLGKKYSVIYYPEGKFIFDKPIGKLKKGIVKIARESGCQVIPLSLYGTGVKQDFLFDKKLIWKNIYIKSGNMLKYKDYNNDEKFLEKLTSEMKNLYIDLEKKHSKEYN
jgi:1-acyl-sn-glycerol-3-phosphate acyltransferase